MLIVNDFVCDNSKCSKHGAVEEIFHRRDDEIHCSECKCVLSKQMPNPAGMVVGTSNPCPKRKN